MNDPTRPATTILVVGDDQESGPSLSEALAFGGYGVQHAATGREARLLLRSARPDLVLLELMLPDADGLVLLDDLTDGGRVPVVVCSRSRRKQDPVLALRLGAEDFLGRPVAEDELRTRVRAVLGRARTIGEGAHGRAAGAVHIGELEIDHVRRLVRLSGAPLQLTPTEYRVLTALASRPGEVIPHDDLARLVWGYPDTRTSRTIHVLHAHICRLRSKLRGQQLVAPRIVAVRGFGYTLTDGTDSR
jgi:two-component system KDP operon response regulator KdpE